MKTRRELSPSPKALRARAEQLLGTTGREVAQMPVADVQKLVHELQVHQIELEMQNEELHRAQRELETARDRYVDLYDFAPVAHLTLKADGEILEANLHAGQLLGLERDRLLHQKFSHFIPAAAQDTFYLLCQRVFSSGTRQSAELDLVNAPAKRLTVQIEAVRDATSPRKQCRFSFTDITERKRAEVAVRESEEKFRLLFATVADAVFVFDAETRKFVEINDAALRMYGYTREQLQQLTAMDLTAEPKASEESISRVVAGVANRVPLRYHKKRDGTVFPVEICASHFVLRGRPMYCGIVRDITERKQAEMKLQASEERFRRLFENMAEGFAYCQMIYEHGVAKDLVYLAVNEQFEVLTGLKNVIGKRLSEVIPGTLESDAELFARYVRVSETGQPEKFEVFVEALKQWFSISLYCPEPERFVAVFDVITERKRTEERIAQLNRVQAIIAGIDRAMIHLADQQQLLDEVCRVAVDTGGFKLAWVGLVAPDDTVQPVAKAGAIEYLDGIHVVTRKVPAGCGPVGTAIRENRPVVIEDIGQNRSMAPWRDRTRQFELHYVAAFPLRIAGQVAGAFQVYAPQAGFFDETELRLLSQVSDEISFALTAMAELAARKEAEAALRRSEYNLTNFFNQAPIGLVWLSAGGVILRANLAQLDLLGYTAEEYLGHAFVEFCGEPAQGLELLRRLATKETVRNFPMTRRCKDGTLRHGLVDANSFWSDIWGDKQFQYSSIFLRDVTDRVELEREILQAGEREHRRIAQDLHDGLGQLLVGAAYLTGILRQDLAVKSRPEARKLGRILEVINEAITQTRSLARGLHPVAPEPNGLMVALETLASRTHKMFQVRCHFSCRRPVLIQDNAVATHLFRIAQEAITNAIKHGKPGRIEIGLAETPGRINLAIKDNGAGMPARTRKKPGMGLRIMRYRAGIIGGSLVIQKPAGGGTTIVCTVHVDGEAGVTPTSKRARKKKKIKKD